MYSETIVYDKNLMVRIDSETLGSLRKLARAEDLSQAAMVRRIIRDAAKKMDARAMNAASH